MQSEDIDLFGHLAQCFFVGHRPYMQFPTALRIVRKRNVLGAGQSPQPKGDGRRGMTISVTDVVCVRVPLIPAIVNA